VNQIILFLVILKIYIGSDEYNINMFNEPCSLDRGSPTHLTARLLDELRDAMLCVRKARKWFLVDPLTRAFVKACMIMRLGRVKSILLMKAIIKAIKELKRIASQEYRLVEIGLPEAWRLSELASSWGHKKARGWRSNKAYVILQALTLQWISRLFNGIVKI
jgi:hypothetical protein